MKYLALFILLASVTLAQVATDYPLGSTIKPLDNLESTTFTMPANAVRVSRIEAFERVYKTTETMTTAATRTVYWVKENGDISSRTQVFMRYTRSLVQPTTYTTRIKSGYFVHPLTGLPWRVTQP